MKNIKLYLLSIFFIIVASSNAELSYWSNDNSPKAFSSMVEEPAIDTAMIDTVEDQRGMGYVEKIDTAKLLEESRRLKATINHPTNYEDLYAGIYLSGKLLRAKLYREAYFWYWDWYCRMHITYQMLDDKSSDKREIGQITSALMASAGPNFSDYLTDSLSNAEKMMDLATEQALQMPYVKTYFPKDVKIKKEKEQKVQAEKIKNSLTEIKSSLEQNANFTNNIKNFFTEYFAEKTKGGHPEQVVNRYCNQEYIAKHGTEVDKKCLPSDSLMRTFNREKNIYIEYSSKKGTKFFVIFKPDDESTDTGERVFLYVVIDTKTGKISDIHTEDAFMPMPPTKGGDD